MEEWKVGKVSGGIKGEIEELEQLTQAVDFWQDQKKAEKVSRDLKNKQKIKRKT